jgi:thiamine phosphate synthase YjbQ (UPF0047 family)
MPQQHSTISPLSTFLIATCFLVALFPSTFVSIAWAPYNSLVNYAFPLPPHRETVLCTSPNICVAAPTMSWYDLLKLSPMKCNVDGLDRFQKPLTLPSRTRGSYLITDHIVKELPEIKSYKTGLLNLFIQHTSCALSLNENYDDDVRADMSDALDRIVPEDKGSRKGLYRHDAEGSDDMPVSKNL